MNNDEPRSFEGVDLSGARFRRVRLGQARFRMVDLSAAVLRDVRLVDASIDGAELDGLRIDGVEIAPLVAAELERRDPARALRQTSDPEQLREAWAAIESSWAAECSRASQLPGDAAHARVKDEWSFVETLRHLVFVTDAWLGSVLHHDPAYHPWGVPFDGAAEFMDLAALGLDPGAQPTLEEVVALRDDYLADVRRHLAGVTADDLGRTVPGPPYADDPTLLQCVHAVLNEELEHLRFARRDLDVLERSS